MPYTSLWAKIPFVGRIEQLRQLAEHRGHLEGNRDRVRHLVLIDGFDGVGKTALADEFLSRIGRDETVVTARAAYSPYLRRPPLAPLLEALDELCSNSFLRRRLLPLFTDQVYRPLLSRLPVLESMVRMDEELPPTMADAGTLASLAAAVLVHIARFRPVVLFIDDAHSMTEEEMQAFLALNAGLRRAPVMIVMATRRDLPETEVLVSTLEPVIADRLYLPPLSTGEVAEMVTRLCGAKVSALLAPEIARLSSGSPQRTLEILRLLHDRMYLISNGAGEWSPGPAYNGTLSIDQESPAERIDRLEENDRRMLLLLECAGGVARRDELAAWYDALTGEEPGQAVQMLRGLEGGGLIKAVYARPEEVTFAHERFREESYRTATDENIDAVAAMIVRTPSTRRDLRRWSGHEPLLRSILRQLPPAGSVERDELLGQFLALNFAASFTDEAQEEKIYSLLNECREYLLPREHAYVLLHSTSLAYKMTRFAAAISMAQELHRLTLEQPECAGLRALAAADLATAHFFNDRSSDVSEILEEAEKALVQTTDATERNYAEVRIARLHAMQVPPSNPHEAIIRARRVYFLFEQLEMEAEKREIFSLIVVNAARARDEGQLRMFCSMLLRELRDGRRLPQFHSVFQAVRSSILIGDIFQAREIFETWSSRSAPVGVQDFMIHTHLTSMFALVDAEPSLAADMALSGREEFIRFRATSKQILWELVYAYVALQAGLLTSLLAAGRYTEALTITEAMEQELSGVNINVPGAAPLLQLFRSWLLWRCILPADAPTALCWPTSRGSLGGSDARIRQAVESTDARTAAEEFRAVYRTTLTGVAPQVRYHAEMLLAQLESLEGDQGAALASIGRAAAACAQAYSWNFDLDSRAAMITVRIRQAADDPSAAQEILQKVVEDLRDLFGIMTEKGQAARIAQLATMFIDETGRVGRAGRDTITRIEQSGSAATAAAHLVLRNSRSKGQGPIERARLFLMGPLRLMRPYSYMELSETSFERETARTLLIALVAAAVLGQRLTREELSMRIAPKARTPEQQKKALYNAASAARAACGSPGSILPVGSNSLELNINPELEGSLWVDVIELIRAVRNGEQHEAAGSLSLAFEAYQQAILLASKGEFASDCYAEWIDPARDLIRETIRGAALSLGRIALRNGLYQAGIQAVSAQLTRDPFDEESHRMLIELYRETGNRTAALKQFEKCRAVLQEEFGVEPEKETLLLRKQLVE